MGLGAKEEKMAKKTGDIDQATLLKTLLADKAFISTLARKIAAELRAAAGTKPDPAELWVAELEAIEMEKDEACTPKRLAEMFVLAEDEIERVGTRIRTAGLKGKLTLEGVREQVLAQIGDDVLMARAGADSAGAGAARCGDEHACGFPYHCGYEVDCGVKYELFCPTLHMCGSKKDCDHSYWGPKDYGGQPYGYRPGAERPVPRKKSCGDDYQCGQPFYCGHEVQCGTPYELLPCGPLYHYYCRPRKDCPSIYYNSGGA